MEVIMMTQAIGITIGSQNGHIFADALPVEEKGEVRELSVITDWLDEEGIKDHPFRS